MKQAQATQKERGIISHSGMGGFLNPPTHPEHNYHVMFDLRRRKENRGGMSLSAAVESEWLDDEVKNEAKEMLNKWEAPDINSPEIKDWIYSVLGYFNNCYSKDGINRNVNDGMEIIENIHPMDERIVNRHLGVMMVREFYPSYQPTNEDFKNAYWGNKKA